MSCVGRNPLHDGMKPEEAMQPGPLAEAGIGEVRGAGQRDGRTAKRNVFGAAAI